MEKPKRFFWIVGIIALLWNLMGINQYIQQAYMTNSFKAMFTEEQLELIKNAPAWSTAAFALAVFGGFIASILLLLRKKSAKTVFIISLIAVLVQMYYNFFVIDSIAIYGPGATAMPILIVTFGLFFIWFSKYSIKKNWIA